MRLAEKREGCRLGYYQRYFVSSSKVISLDILHHALQDIDPLYSISNDREIQYGDSRYGIIEIDYPNDPLFRGELKEFKDELADLPQSNAKTRVSQFLNQTQVIIAVQVLWQGRNTEETFRKLYPLWVWLFQNYDGVLQIDEEGYYEANGPLLLSI